MVVDNSFDTPRTEEIIYKKLSHLANTKWEHNLGDGKASERIYMAVSYLEEI